jgi:DNA mismatch repair protein MSH6
LTPSNNDTPKLKVKRGVSKTPIPLKEGFELGSIVWAKLDGFPWWPSLVCLHPVKKVEKEGGSHAYSACMGIFNQGQSFPTR